jgi:hypothetical protein
MTRRRHAIRPLLPPLLLRPPLLRPVCHALWCSLLPPPLYASHRLSSLLICAKPRRPIATTPLLVAVAQAMGSRTHKVLPNAAKPVVRRNCAKNCWIWKPSGVLRRLLCKSMRRRRSATKRTSLLRCFCKVWQLCLQLVPEVVLVLFRSSVCLLCCWLCSESRCGAALATHHANAKVD